MHATLSAEPRLAAPLLVRSRLLARLNEFRPLAVVRAPTGFGKTVLLSQWRSRRPAAQADSPAGQRWARLRVPAGAGEATAFWVGVVDALTEAGLPFPTLAERRSTRGLADRMLSAAGPLVLVVDNFENVTEAGIDQELVETVSGVTDLRVVVATRSRRHFPDEVCGRVPATLITARDLLLRSDETAELLSAFGLSPGAYRSDMLHESTGGWPELAHAVLTGLKDSPADPLEIFAVAARTAIGYLRRRLLPDIEINRSEINSSAGSSRSNCLEFAMITSLTDEFTVDLAESLGAADAARTVTWLEREGLLATSCRNDETVHRWADAARFALREELFNRYPDRLGELHARVARWSLQHSRPGQALAHALDAHDWPLVLEILETSWRALRFTDPPLLHRAFATAPAEVLTASTRVIALRELIVPTAETKLAEMATLPRTAGHLARLGMSEKAQEVLDTGILLTAALRSRGHFGIAADYSDRLRTVAAAARSTRSANGSELFAEVNVNAGISAMLIGDFRSAEHPLRTAHECIHDAGPVERAAVTGLLALDHALLGEVFLARHWLAEFDLLALGHGPRTRGIRLVAAAARLLTDLDRLAPAPVADPAPHSPGRYPDDLWAFRLYARAQHALYLGDPVGMVDRLRRERTAHQDLLGRDAIARPLLEAAEVALLLSAGRADQADQILQRADAHPLLLVPTARLALLRGDAGAAERLAADQTWEQVATTRDRLEMLLLKAVARHRRGDRAGAVRGLQLADQIATATGLVRPFTTVPRADLDQLADEVPAIIPRLASRTGWREPYPCAVAVVQLTDREHRVLRQIADGSTLEQVAEQLVVSYNTVKTHVRNIYRKLQAGTRDDAIARARELGLLDSAHS